MTELDRTQQRIVGVLMEKALAVPDSYPLTEKALLAGCNQKSNRDPEMALEQFELSGALNALMADGWVMTATSQGGYATRYAHKLDSHHSVDAREKAVLCELLVRGPQAPGALKPRVVRLGFNTSPAEIEEVLRGLAGRPTPLVERLEKRPRERDHRWRHCLGPADPAHGGEVSAGGAPESEPLATPEPATPEHSTPEHSTPRNEDADLIQRIAQLEAEVAELRDQIRSILG